MKASDLKKGLVLDIDGRNILVRDLDVQSPSSRSGSTLYKVRGFDIVSKQKYENRFKGDESVQTVEFGRRPVQFLYRDAESCTFMDRESYEQYALNARDLQEELQYLSEDLEGLSAMIADVGERLGKLPVGWSVDLCFRQGNVGLCTVATMKLDVS